MRKNLKGFTLIELIIVIVIIGILAAITIIGYTSQAANARNSSALTSLNDATKAANVCIVNGELLVPTGFTLINTTIAGKSVCVTSAGADSTTVTGKWPAMSNIGGTWGYYNYTVASHPNGAPAAILSTAVTTNTLLVVTGAPSGASNAFDPLKDDGVSCTLLGCTKYGF